MGLPAFAAYERGKTTQSFGAALGGGAMSVTTAPVKSLNAKESGPTQKISQEVRGAKSGLDRAMGQALDAHKRAVQTHGQGMGVPRGRAVNLINPAQDAMMIGAAAIMPVFAPVASAIAIANIVNYAKADRMSKKNRDVLVDMFRAENAPARPLMDAMWRKPGFYSAPATNDNDSAQQDLGPVQEDYLARDIHQQHFMQVLLGQKAQMDLVESSNVQRKMKGLPISRNTLEGVEKSDSIWLRRNLQAPVPGEM